jgi:ABC-2 type transport system permease protein
MRKVWTIFKHEYTRHVLRKRFVFTLLSVPLWIVVMVAAGVISVLAVTNNTPAGYVDQAGVIVTSQLPPPQQEGPFDIELRPYGGEAEARQALDAGTIQAYFVIPEDYPENGRARIVYLEEPDGSVYGEFRELLRASLLRDQPPQVTRRVLEGPQLAINTVQENRQVAERNWFKIAAPLAAGFFLIVSVFTSSGYLMQALVEEKENRTMEILATSVSPGQIMSAKILALICVGLTQVLVWSFFPLAGLGLARAALPFLQVVAIDWSMLGLIAVTALPTFVLISALMAAIGATVTEAREGQQVSTLVTLPVMVPFMLFSAILANPGSPLALAMTFFPLTSALTLLIRMAFSTVPSWQLYTSAAVLALSAVGSLWLAGRLFRVGMLRYGKRLGWRDVFTAMRPGRGRQALPEALETAPGKAERG